MRRSPSRHPTSRRPQKTRPCSPARTMKGTKRSTKGTKSTKETKNREEHDQHEGPGGRQRARDAHGNPRSSTIAGPGRCLAQALDLLRAQVPELSGLEAGIPDRPDTNACQRI